MSAALKYGFGAIGAALSVSSRAWGGGDFGAGDGVIVGRKSRRVERGEKVVFGDVA